MTDHPIQGLMKTAMESIKDMVDVNTIVGDPVETPDGSVIMPISRVSLGFAAGGSEFEGHNNTNPEMPFGGGSGAGVSVQPVAFLVVGNGHIRLLPVEANHMLDRLLDVAPNILTQAQNMLGKNNDESPSPITTPPPTEIPSL